MMGADQWLPVGKSKGGCEYKGTAGGSFWGDGIVL